MSILVILVCGALIIKTLPYCKSKQCSITPTTNRTKIHLFKNSVTIHIFIFSLESIEFVMSLLSYLHVISFYRSLEAFQNHETNESD